MIKRIMKNAIRLLINNSIEDDGVDKVENFIMNSDGRVSPRDIRLILEEDFGAVSVSDNLNLFLNNRTFKSATPIIERKDWSRTMANTMMEYVNNIEGLLPDLTVYQRKLLAPEKKKASDYRSTLFFMSCSPELQREFKGEFWRRTAVTTKEIDDFMRVYSAPTVSSESNSNVCPTGVKGDHLPSECQELKKHMPNGVIPQEDVKEGSAAWIALLKNMEERITAQFCTDEWNLNTVVLHI